MSGSDWFLDYVIAPVKPGSGYTLLLADRPAARRGYNQPRHVYLFTGHLAHHDARTERPRPVLR